MDNPGHIPNEPEFKTGGGLKRLLGFLVLALICLAAGYFTPLKKFFEVKYISDFVVSLGIWGPAFIIAAGIVTPILFIPRWPIAFVGGLMYGIFWGSILANIASTIGAYLHFMLAKTLLSPMAERLRHRYGIHASNVPQDKVFAALFFLRAFPLSNFVATNLLAGAMKIRTNTYLSASFLGMIPSTIMYAAWGKLMKKPSTEYYVLAIAIMVILVAGTLMAQKLFSPWLKRVTTK
jgi:uncharacterized membrane protein YdjX (TVP38/TMEM64 family)